VTIARETRPEGRRLEEGQEAFEAAGGAPDAPSEGRGRVDFSVILVNFNSAAYIEPCLAKVRAQEPCGSCEIIVINNRSTDGSLEILKRQRDITIIDRGANLGFSRANNLAVAASRGKYMLCLNFDCLIEPDFLRRIREAFEARPDVAMISGKLRKLADMKETMYLDSTGIDFTACIPADRGEWQYDRGQYDGETVIFGPSGAAAAYRRDALEAVRCKDAYFDEEMFVYCEDIDLAWRLNLAGWRGFYVPQAIAYHERGATRKDSFWKRVGYVSTGFRNRYFTMLKNLRRREDVRGRLWKLARQEWRFLSSWCGDNPGRWGLGAYTVARVLWLVLTRSFFEKRRLAQSRCKASGLDLHLDSDYRQLAYDRRKKRPTAQRHRGGAPAGICVDKDDWLVSVEGFAGEAWGDESFFSGRTAAPRPFVEIHVPEPHQASFGRGRLYLELEAGAAMTADIYAYGPGGRPARSDWFLIDAGKGAYVIDLGKMDLAPGARNLAMWQGPWLMMRLNVSTGIGATLSISDLRFLKEGVSPHGAATGDQRRLLSNADLNAAECRRLPLVVESRPTLVYAEVSTYCNMRCSMCGRGVYGVNASEQGFMSREVFERLSRIFTPGARLALFGRGETLLHPEFPAFLKIACERGMAVCLNSNGKALTPELSHAMVEYGQHSITFSCSAGTAATYEAIHRGGRWDRLWGNIAGLIEARKGRSGGFVKPAIYLEFVSQADNIAELPALVRRAMEWRLDGLLVIDMVAHSDELEAKRMNTPENAALADRYYAETLEVAKRLRRLQPRFDLRLPALYDSLTKKSVSAGGAASARDLGEEIARVTGGDPAKNFCLEPWQTFYARFDGKVMPCVITNRSLGDLNREDAVDIWNGPHFRKFRERMRSPRKPFECLRCHLFPGPKRYDRALDRAEEYAPL